MLDQYSVDYGVNLVFIENCQQKNGDALKKKHPQNAAVSISIGHGHFHTENYPEGITHLLEHMLFSSSANTHSECLDQHLFKSHGQTNAWTQDTCMNFQLSCKFSGFTEACELLLDKMTSPLFLEEEIQQEILAIDAEFKLKQKDQARQLLSVQKATCNRKHPFVRFSTGNQASFSAHSTYALQSALKNVHREILMSAPIAICIGIPSANYNETTLASLKTLFYTYFKAKRQPNSFSANNLTTRLSDLPLYKQSQEARYIEIKDTRDPKQLIVSFNLIGDHCNASEMVFVTLAHIMESKHKHGLYSMLAAQDYVYELSCGHKEIDPFNREFSVYLSLTNEGCKEQKHIVKYVLDYLHFIRKSGIEAWRFREKEAQHALQNRTIKHASLLTKCIYLSQELLSQTSATKIANTVELTDEISDHHYDAELAHKGYRKIVDQLILDKCRVYFIADDVSTKQLTPYYDVAFSDQALSLQDNTREYGFLKPRKNPYMSSQNFLVKQQIKTNEIYRLKSANIDFKFYQHTFFKCPNGECYLSINDTQMYGTKQKVLAKKVWLSCLNEFLSEQFFDVDLANMRFRVYSHHHGFSLHTGGLSERQLLLLIEITNAIKGFLPTEKSIDKHLKLLQIQDKKITQQKPFNSLFATLNQKYQADIISISELLQSSDSVDTAALLVQFKKYFNDNYVESLVVGNWSLQAINRLFKQFETRFSNHSNDAKTHTHKPSKTTVSINTSEHIHYQNKECTHEHLIWHCIPLLNEQEKLTLEGGNEAAKTTILTLSARSLLMEKLLSQFVFKILRQKYSMGYLLGVGYKPIGSYPGVVMYIDSPTHTANQIHTAMCEIIRQTTDWLDQNKSEMKKLVNELIEQVTPNEVSIDQTAARAWSHFEDVNPLLAYKDLIIALQEVDVDQLKTTLGNMLKNSDGQLILTQSPHIDSGINMP
ncbi:insulinase family protein [Glaciecola petra]|uniref:Insulinase family protein n=1 Tax=Glaciecola petra TaxID=3075602 RepID=A0ABU2ZTI2_9ALTE|nr:insulinase family protein [Aestuariibacter sp. P117]MDT0594712.1 insulinase family protein [Aestuariibacter sp. P117]